MPRRRSTGCGRPTSPSCSGKPDHRPVRLTPARTTRKSLSRDSSKSWAVWACTRARTSSSRALGLVARCARSAVSGESPEGARISAPADNRPYLLLSPEAAEEFAHVPTTPPYDAVVVGLHPPSFAYGPLNTAFRVLTREPLFDAQPSEKRPVLIAPHTAAYLQAPADEEFPAGLSLGIGAYVAALETAADTKAEVVGKPTRAFFELALDKLRKQGDVKTSEVAIVDDDVKNDLGAGAKELGLQRILGALEGGGADHQLRRASTGPATRAAPGPTRCTRRLRISSTRSSKTARRGWQGVEMHVTCTTFRPKHRA